MHLQAGCKIVQVKNRNKVKEKLELMSGEM